jgi:hypothetical protein
VAGSDNGARAGGSASSGADPARGEHDAAGLGNTATTRRRYDGGRTHAPSHITGARTAERERTCYGARSDARAGTDRRSGAGRTRRDVADGSTRRIYE